MNRIKELRETNKIKQIDLAQKLNVSQGTLSNWEGNKFDIDNDSLRRLSDLFNVSTDYILGIERTSQDPYHDPVDAKTNELFQKRKILFDKSAKASVEDLDKIDKMMDIIIGDKDDFSE